MSDDPPTELICLADDEGNSVRVDVLGVEPTWSGGLKAEIVVATSFVSGRLNVWLGTRKLERWAEALDRLDVGEDVHWMDMDRGASVQVQLSGERDCPEVVVEDESGSMATVRVPVGLPDGWIDDHRRRLRQVRDHWVPKLLE
ncbi:DUF5959 family protein [Streptomyces bauhiniae]|uniref:DUF5959 family protein n=1 Tax=Streptomyces bauhiniae TaxID=2340725 RepID=UPI003328EEA2